MASALEDSNRQVELLHFAEQMCQDLHNRLYELAQIAPDKSAFLSASGLTIQARDTLEEERDEWLRDV